MPDRLNRFRRLLETTTGTERLLREGIARAQRVSAQVQRDLQALQALQAPLAPPTADTVADRLHRDRYREIRARQRELLQAQWREAQHEVEVQRRQWVTVAQTQRTLERLLARLEQHESTQRRREEQLTADEHARWRGPL